MQSSERIAKRKRPLVIEISILAGLYLGVGLFGLSLASVNKSASAVWPPTGLCLAVLLLRGPRLWPGVFIGAFLVNYITQGSPLTTLAIATGNTLEALLGYWLVCRFANGLKAFERVRDLFRFVLCASMISTLVSPTIGVTSLCFEGLAHWENYWAVWITWWLGDMVSDVVIAPLIVVLVTSPVPHLKTKTLLQTGGLALVLLLVGQMVFLGWSPFGASNLPLEYLALLPLLWAAFRFGERGAVCSAFVMSCLAVWGTMHGFGPFARQDPNASLLLLQVFLAVITLTALVLVGVIAERRRAERRLQVQDAVSRVLAEAPTLREATPGVFQALAKNGGWEVGAIWEVNPPKERLACVEVWHSDTIQIPEFEACTREFTFTRGVGLPGRVWESGKPAWVPDVTVDSNFPRAPVALKSGLHAAFCFPLRLGNDTVGVVECFSRRVREPDQNFLYMLEGLGGQLGQFIDRKRALAAGQRSEALKAAMLESALDSIITIDREGRIIEFNAAAERTFGMARAEALGLPLDEVMIPHRFRERHKHGMAHYLATGEGPVLGKRMEMPALRRNGTEFPVELYIHPVHFGNELAFTAYLRDITERKSTEQALEYAQQELRNHATELEKRVADRTARLQETIQSLDGFCYSIAHDLRAPLRALGGFSTELEREFGPALGESGMEYINRIRAAAARMDALIVDLLRFGRLNTVELPAKTVQLEVSLHDAMAEMAKEIKLKDAQILIKPPLLAVKANQTVVEQVLVNLIGNALKFVPHEVVPRITIWTEPKGNMVRACVQDNGIGIHPDYVGKLFQPFVRLVDGSQFPGTGIGLAIVRKGVERMGGRAGVESRLGEGSCFWIELPGV